MKHNFWKGMGLFLVAYFVMQLVAYTLLIAGGFEKEIWPLDFLIIFILLFMSAFGYSLTQVNYRHHFEYAKDVSDGFLLGFLGHYTGNFFITLAIFLVVSWIQRSFITDNQDEQA